MIAGRETPLQSLRSSTWVTMGSSTFRDVGGSVKANLHLLRAGSVVVTVADRDDEA